MKVKYKLMGMIVVTVSLCVIAWTTNAFIQLPNRVQTLALAEGVHFIARKKSNTNPELVLVGNRVEYSMNVGLDKISTHLVNAIIASEDRRYRSRGKLYMLARFVQAAALCTLEYAKRLSYKRCAGYSTITQQLAKQLWIAEVRTPQRKIKELLWALKIESTLEREKILELYLNRISLGPGIYGVEMASRRYFGKTANQLSLAESAILAASVRRPSTNWRRDRAGTIKRANIVLRAMHNHGFIDGEIQLSENFKPEKRGRKMNKPFFGHLWVWVKRHAARELSGQPAGIYKIFTSANAEVQIYAEKSILSVTQPLVNSDGKKPQGAVVVMRPNGQIMAMVGGADNSLASRNINRAVPVKGLHCRPPSSLLKTVLYTAALEKGFSLDSKINASPVQYRDQLGNLYSPRNFERKVFGEVSLSNAYIKSVNTAAVRLLAEDIGYGHWFDVARKYGLPVESFRKELGLALGQPAVCLINMMKMFGIIANNGLNSRPHAIIGIYNKSGTAMYQNYVSPPERVFAKRVMRDINHLNQQVLVSGTGRLAIKDIEGPVLAGKTGTNNRFMDAWFIGYSDSVVIGTWIGNDIPRTMPNVTGGSSSALVFNSIIKYLLKHTTLI